MTNKIQVKYGIIPWVFRDKVKPISFIFISMGR
jgi:hypothetical protein